MRQHNTGFDSNTETHDIIYLEIILCYYLGVKTIEMDCSKTGKQTLPPGKGRFFQFHILCTLGETWLGKYVSWFIHILFSGLFNVHLRETWLRNNVSLLVHHRETWLGNNVSERNCKKSRKVNCTSSRENK